MPINLKGRSILTLDELSAAEIRFLLRLAAELKAAKSAGIEAAAAQGQEHRPHLREGLDAHAHRLRGGGLRPGRARHLPRPDRQPDRPQGVHEGHGARARPHLRCHRVSRLQPAICPGACRVLGRSRLQRADRRGAPDASAGRFHDHARVHAQAPLRHGGGVHGRRAQQRGTLAGARRRQARHGHAAVRPARALAGEGLQLQASRYRVGHERPAARVRRSAARRCREPTSSIPTCGCRWASPRRSGRSGYACSSPTA